MNEYDVTASGKFSAKKVLAESEDAAKAAVLDSINKTIFKMEVGRIHFADDYKGILEPGLPRYSRWDRFWHRLLNLK